MVVVLAGAWAAVVVGAVAIRRPLPAPRLAMLDVRHGSEPAHRRPTDAAHGTRTRVGARLASRPDLRRVARVAALGVLGAAVHPLLGAALVAVVLARPALAVRRVRRAHAAAVATGLADTVTLVGLAVGAGHNLLGALRAAAARGTGPVAESLRGAVADATRGERLADALEALPSKLGDDARPIVAALVACDRYGAALGATLERLGNDVRVASRQRAEAAARRVPVRLLFPLVTCILPAFGLLTVAPLIAGSLRGLRL